MDGGANASPVLVRTFLHSKKRIRALFSPYGAGSIIPQWKGGWTMPQQNQNTEQNKQLVQRFVEECWNRGNLNKASEFLTDQVRFQDPVFPNLSSGIQSIKNHIE